MKKDRKLLKSIFLVALATVAVLMVPLVAMFFTNEVNWGIGDFIVMGGLLFGTGLSFVLLTRFATDFAYRLGVGLGLGTMLFMVWANLAVGLVGAGPNAGNLMYIGVLLVGIIGIVVSKLKAKGMERTMLVMVVTLVVVAVIELLAGMHEYPGSSVREIIGVNGFFAFLFGASALIFHFSGKGNKGISPEPENMV